jgi:hypothetical protein
MVLQVSIFLDMQTSACLVLAAALLHPRPEPDLWPVALSVSTAMRASTSTHSFPRAQIPQQTPQMAFKSRLKPFLLEATASGTPVVCLCSDPQMASN